jgi:beta-lactam-binding protein with PASTA domain
MRDDDEVIIPGRRYPSLLGVMFVSTLISAVVSVVTVLSVLRGWPFDLTALATMSGAARTEVTPQDSRVPDVNGMAAEAADELLSARKLRLVVRDRRADPKVPVGAVIAQTPLAQSRIQAGGEVSVVLSTGPERLQVPPLVGQTLEQAKQSIEAAGLRVGPISDSDKGEPGTVTAVVPESGSAVDSGATIALTVARPSIAVPKLIGHKLSDARDVLEKAGLTVGHVSEIYDAHKRGNLVLTQDPKGGAAVAPGSKVDLVVNQGD